MEEKPEGGKPLQKPALKLKWHDLHDLDIPNEFYLQFRVVSGHIMNTLATDKSFHCLQSGVDIREKPVVAGIVSYDLNLWGKSDVTD